MAKDGSNVVELDLERSRKFLQHIVEDPFVAVVVTDEGEVRVFSKDMDPEHLARIKNVLSDLTRKDTDGEEDHEG